MIHTKDPFSHWRKLKRHNNPEINDCCPAVISIKWPIIARNKHLFSYSFALKERRRGCLPPIKLTTAGEKSKITRKWQKTNN